MNARHDAGEGMLMRGAAEADVNTDRAAFPSTDGSAGPPSSHRSLPGSHGSIALWVGAFHPTTVSAKVAALVSPTETKYC